MTISESMMRDLYLDLLQKTLVNEIYKDRALKKTFWSKVSARIGMKTKHVEGEPFNKERRDGGRDWPSVAHTMIGRKRMENLRQVLCEVIEKKVEGDFIETGVWRGGACIFARGIMKSYGVTDRNVWVADSFSGLPKPNDKKYIADRGDKHNLMAALAVSREEVEDNFRIYGLLDGQVRFLVGWFSETLANAPIEKLAVLRLDGDMYESTMDAMEALYHKVTPGGYVIVDDYYAVKGCRLAVHDFLNKNALNEKVTINEIDGKGVYWQKL